MRSLRERTQRITELLSPAGSFDAARAAVNAGADAIYMGGPLFSARAFAESSNSEMLSETLDFCHLRGVNVYMTLNTLLKDSELDTVKEYLRPYVDKKLDAVIVQDLGVLRRVREWYPKLEIHISTQAAVTGVRSAARFLEMGAHRIVLARELSLKEISKIKEQTGAELEVFAHGALCYCYSGNCLMSSFIGGRSGNRGSCAGTCRLPFDVYDEQDKRLNNKDEQYLLSMCDLNTLRRLPEMIAAGVYSFKIEGRMKSPVYTAAVTGIYRKYLDMSEKCVLGLRDTYEVATEDERQLAEVFDRSGSTDGYLDGRNGRDMLTLKAKPEHRQRDEELIEEIKTRYIDNDIRLPIYARLRVRSGEPLSLEYSYGDIRASRISKLKAQAAERHPATKTELAERIAKLGGSNFELQGCEVDLQGDCFVPVAALNELRRETLHELKKHILESHS